jgi:hypothetical protein
MGYRQWQRAKVEVVRSDVQSVEVKLIVCNHIENQTFFNDHECTEMSREWFVDGDSVGDNPPTWVTDEQEKEIEAALVDCSESLLW